MKKKRGRPSLPKGVEKRSVIIPIRLKASEYAKFQKSAIKAGVSLSEYVRSLCWDEGATGVTAENCVKK